MTFRWLEIIEILERKGYRRDSDNEPPNAWQYSNGKYVIRVIFPGRVEIVRS